MANILVGVVGLFLSGFVAALNISILMPHNEGYVASWYKVGLCAIFAVLGAVLVFSEKKKGR